MRFKLFLTPITYDLPATTFFPGYNSSTVTEITTPEADPQLHARLRRNLPLHYAFVFLMEFGLSRGIWMLYLAFKGLSLFQIGLMETIFHVTSFLMEVPTGAIADLYGRKTSRILGRAADIISTALILLSKDFTGIAIGFVFSALSYNLESGAGDALVFDSMKQIGEEDRYVRVRGKTEVVFQAVSVISLLIGGYIATLSFDRVYQVSLVIGVLALASAFKFTEPTIGRPDNRGNVFKLLLKQVIDSLSVIRKDKRVAGLILLTELVGVFCTTIFFYIQNYYKDQGLNTFQIGVVLAVGSVLAAIVASQAERIKALGRLRVLLVVISIAMVVSLWGILIEGLGYAFFALLGTFYTVLWILSGDAIHQLIPSEQRATIISLQSMLFSLGMIVLFPIVGKVGDLYGLRTAFVGVAAAATLALVAFMLALSVITRRYSKSL
jgi:MFS family permease